MARNMQNDTDIVQWEDGRVGNLPKGLATSISSELRMTVSFSTPSSGPSTMLRPRPSPSPPPLGHSPYLKHLSPPLECGAVLKKARKLR